ncbi:type III secretion system chaperone [Ramlibacter sp. AN1015]|uniref:type III secretion system chaperone n=1 Tax=Ramlibacter sp. AN1015 TaxID=3133428 RepID=UPI0030C0BB21
MDKRSLAEKLIANFGQLLTLPELTLDATTNSCVLLFDGDIILNIEFDDVEGQLILSTYLAEAPAEGGERLLRELMVANLYWHRTDGATLGLEEASNGIILAHARAVTELDDASFEKLVETFVNQAERWKKRIAEIADEGDAPPAPAHLGDSASSARDGPRIFG